MTTPSHITFTCDEHTLHADLHAAAGEWAALIMHGWTGYRGGSGGALAQVLASEGCMSLCVNLPGHGDSDGNREQISLDEFDRAAGAAYDQLIERAPDRNVLIVGTSFGGALAARLVGTRAAEALALRVPANYEPYGRAIESVERFAGPVLVLEAQNDTVIPHSLIEQYVAAAQHPTHVVVPDAPHSLSTVPAKLAQSNELLRTWFADVVASTGGAHG